MSKISQKEIARQMYIEGKYFAEIAKALDVSASTLSRWAKADGWEKNDAKEEIYKTKISEDMHKLASRLLEDISDEYMQDKTLNPERFAAFDRLMARINGAKKYDDETTHAEQRQTITPETIAKVLKEMI